MKTISRLILVFLVFSLLLTGCSSSGSTKPSTSQAKEMEAGSTAAESSVQKTPLEQLNAQERALYDIIIDKAKSDFEEPSSVKILEIGDYENRTRWSTDSLLYGPDTIVVRLQGYNKYAGSSHYYMICIKDGQSTTESGKKLIESLSKLVLAYRAVGDTKNANSYAKQLMEYSAKKGDYVDLGDSYSFKTNLSSDSEWDIAMINKALSDYWSSFGL